MKVTKTDYASSGVSIERGEELVDRIKEAARATHRPGVMGSLGGFGGLFDLAAAGYRDPVLVSGTDGVGTKIKLAIEAAKHDTIGIDLVAMCVNDLLVLGAEPLFFLDYLACAQLDVTTAETVINGIATGCKQAGCALIGGETAEMPGMYQDNDYDLAGFCVGVAERDELITGEQAGDGDIIMALPSSGPHSNGYSMIRKILSDNAVDPCTSVDNTPLIDLLLRPTCIYTRQVMALKNKTGIKAMAHITGGGITCNLPRVLPGNVSAHIDTRSWEWPAIFRWLQQQGNVETEEMYRTFNCGAGMLLIIAPEERDNFMQCLESSADTAWEIGRISPAGDSTTVVYE